MARGRGKETLRLRVKGGYLDHQVVFLVMTLTCFGILMVYSASSHKAMVIGTTSMAIATKQAALAGIGLVAMYIASVFNYELFRKLSTVLMIASVSLSVLVFIIGTASHGSMRWIPLGPVQFQPSEVAKFAIAVYVADRCVHYPSRLTDPRGVLKTLALPVANTLLIAKENLSTGVICFGIALGIVFVASPKTRYTVIVMIAGAIGAFLMIKLAGYRSDRITNWLHPEESGKGSQIMNALYAVGSGGLFGRGLGQSIEKTKLPEANNDMIFSVICEELGIFGAVCVIALFAMLVIRMNLIARDSKDRFGGLIVSGILVQIAAQAILNMGVATNLLPNTGMALPFISSGGTSIIVLMAEVGVCLNVSRQGVPYEKVRIPEGRREHA